MITKTFNNTFISPTLTAGLTLTSRNNSSLCVDKCPHIMRVAFKGPGSDPLPILLVHSGGDELKLDDGAL